MLKHCTVKLEHSDIRYEIKHSLSQVSEHTVTVRHTAGRLQFEENISRIQIKVDVNIPHQQPPQHIFWDLIINSVP